MQQNSYLLVVYDYYLLEINMSNEKQNKYSITNYLHFEHSLQ